MTKKDRGNVWLAAAGLLIDENGRLLVVKKNYGGLKGKWSIPAGFVDAGETVDEAAVREVYEETGIFGEVSTILGIRSGVIKETISDNMVVLSWPRVIQNGGLKVTDWIYEGYYIDSTRKQKSLIIVVKKIDDMLNV